MLLIAASVHTSYKLNLIPQVPRFPESRNEYSPTRAVLAVGYERSNTFKSSISKYKLASTKLNLLPRVKNYNTQYKMVNVLPTIVIIYTIWKIDHMTYKFLMSTAAKPPHKILT